MMFTINLNSVTYSNDVNVITKIKKICFLGVAQEFFRVNLKIMYNRVNN